jgi:hypothetical protein
MKDVSRETLKETCRAFEARHGIDAFLETMAEVMQERLAPHGLDLQFDDGLPEQDAPPVPRATPTLS